MNAALSSDDRDISWMGLPIYSCVGRTPSRRALLRNHRHCMRDSIYFVYSAEKCFHLRGNCQSDSRGGRCTMEKGGKGVKKRGKSVYDGRKQDRGER